MNHLLHHVIYKIYIHHTVFFYFRFNRFYIAFHSKMRTKDQQYYVYKNNNNNTKIYVCERTGEKKMYTK